MKKIIMIYVILFFASCMTMKHQKPKITVTTLSENCVGLHTFLTENWYKHRKKKCHKDFDAYKFVYEYKGCISNLVKTQVIGLFGEPDIITEYGEFRYILDADCSNSSLRNYNYLSIDFTKNFVKNVEVGGVSIVE